MYLRGVLEQLSIIFGTHIKQKKMQFTGGNKTKNRLQKENYPGAIITVKAKIYKTEYVLKRKPSETKHK